MKIFALINEHTNAKPNTFLIYYETTRTFYIEITDGADEWDVPFYFSYFVKSKIYSINPDITLNWIRQRIVPTDRQNLGQILRDNKLKSYDEYELLMLGKGRCAQDDYRLDKISEDELPKCILNRFSKRIDDLIPLSSSFSLLVFFCDGKAKICNLEPLIKNDTYLSRYLSLHPERFNNVKIESGGHCISWNDNMYISSIAMYSTGKNVPLAKEDIISFISQRTVNTAEAAEILNCTRQNIDDLIKRGKLTPVKTTAKDKLFLKSDILKREWN